MGLGDWCTLSVFSLTTYDVQVCMCSADNEFQFVLSDTKLQKLAPKVWKSKDCSVDEPLLTFYFRVKYYVANIGLLKYVLSLLLSTASHWITVIGCFTFLFMKLQFFITEFLHWWQCWGSCIVCLFVCLLMCVFQPVTRLNWPICPWEGVTWHFGLWDWDVKAELPNLVYWTRWWIWAA